MSNCEFVFTIQIHCIQSLYIKESKLQIMSLYLICLLRLCERTADKKALAHAAILGASQPNQATDVLSVLSSHAKGAGAICAGKGIEKARNSHESAMRETL